MGHVRLGKLPRTRAWGQVVALLDEGAAVPQVAAASGAAAQATLRLAPNDPGFVHAFWLLTQLPLAARSAHYLAELRRLGFTLAGAPGLSDLAAAAGAAMDTHLTAGKQRSDLGEMAQADYAGRVRRKGARAEGSSGRDAGSHRAASDG